MGGNNRSPSLFDPDSLTHAAELQLLQAEYQRALQEPPWDGTSNVVCMWLFTCSACPDSRSALTAFCLQASVAL